MTRIHSLACVEAGAMIADDAEIGPFCVIGPHAVIGSGCRLVAHVVVAGHTSIGERTVVHQFASLGGPPQSAAYRGEPTRLEIGSDCDIREGVTMSRGTQGGGGVTRVGDRGFFMAAAHVAHDCQVGNDVVFANCATLGGHCVIGDHVFMGGIAAVHQFARIGAHAMIGGMSGVRGDVIPFGLAGGMAARLSGINVIGMKRRGFSSETVMRVRKAYRRLFLDAPSLEEGLAAIEEEWGADPAVAEVVNFVRARGKRPLCRPGSAPESSDGSD